MNLRRHALTLATGAVALALCFWMITQGTFAILYHHGFDAFYDGQAASLLHGHWDVPEEAIMGEAFVFKGKYYGYFGFTPALPRMVLNWLFPSKYGHWTALLMLFWVASIIAVIVLFMDEFEVPSSPLLMAAAILGSTLFFLCSHAIVYHEAILTASALALWAYLFFYRYLRDPRIVFLSIGCLLAFLSFFSRVSVGAGPLLVAAFLLYRRPLKHATIVALFLAVTAVTFVSINHAKFETWLDPSPFEYQIQFDAARLARIDGKLSHIGNLPFDASAYFGPARIRLTKSFPWFGLSHQRPSPESAAKIDLFEGYSSIPAAMPALAILSILGLLFAAKRPAAPPILIASFLAGSLILTLASITYRYLHDFYPFLVIAAILGVGAMQSRPALKSIVAIAAIWSIAANFAFTIKWQREDFFAELASEVEYLRFRDRVNSLLAIERPTSIATDRFDLRVKFPEGRTGQRIMLWQAGTDALFMEYLLPMRIVLCPKNQSCGAATEIDPSREYSLQISADRLNYELIVTLDGKTILKAPMVFSQWTNQEAHFPDFVQRRL